jgi:hypothetical protein
VIEDLARKWIENHSGPTARDPATQLGADRWADQVFSAKAAGMRFVMSELYLIENPDLVPDGRSFADYAMRIADGHDLGNVQIANFLNYLDKATLGLHQQYFEPTKHGG